MSRLPGPHPRLGVLADVHVEQAVVGDVEGMAQLGAAGEQEAGVAAGLGRGLQTMRVNQLKALNSPKIRQVTGY